MEQKYTTLVAFTAVIDRPNNSILMIKRTHFPYPRKWSLPGGVVENDTHPTITAYKKVLEETGYMVCRPYEPNDFVGHYPFSDENGSFQAAIYVAETYKGVKKDSENIRWIRYNTMFAADSALERLVRREKVALPVVKVLKDLKLL